MVLQTIVRALKWVQLRATYRLFSTPSFLWQRKKNPLKVTPKSKQKPARNKSPVSRTPTCQVAQARNIQRHKGKKKNLCRNAHCTQRSRKFHSTPFKTVRSCLSCLELYYSRYNYAHERGGQSNDTHCNSGFNADEDMFQRHTETSA